MLAQFIPVASQVPLGPRPVKLQVPEGETELPAVIRRNPSFSESGVHSERPNFAGETRIEWAVATNPQTKDHQKKIKDSKALVFAQSVQGNLRKPFQQFPGGLLAWPLPRVGATAVPR